MAERVGIQSLRLQERLHLQTTFFGSHEVPKQLACQISTDLQLPTTVGEVPCPDYVGKQALNTQPQEFKRRQQSNSAPSKTAEPSDPKTGRSRLCIPPNTSSFLWNF